MNTDEENKAGTGLACVYLVNNFYGFEQAPIPLFFDYLLLVPGPGVRIEQDGHSPTGLFAPSLDMPPPKVPRRVQVRLHLIPKMNLDNEN